jgi:hypothetical protein
MVMLLNSFDALLPCTLLLSTRLEQEKEDNLFGDDCLVGRH